MELYTDKLLVGRLGRVERDKNFSKIIVFKNSTSKDDSNIIRLF